MADRVLPSSGAASSWLHDPDRVVVPVLVFDIVQARASSELLTAAEWREAIDYEAARMVLQPADEADRPYFAARAKAIIDAALEET